MTVSYACDAAISGVETNNLAGGTLTTEGANQSFTGTGSCVDKAGNSSGPVAVTGIDIDKSAPVVTATRTPANAAGWNDANVTVSYACNAAISGVANNTLAGGTVTTEGANQSFTGTGACVDQAGNSSAPVAVAGIRIDKTDPTISDVVTPAAPNGQNGWYTSNVTNTFNAADALSGLSTGCDTAFPKAVVASTEGAAVTVSSGACADVAGNTAAAITSATFKIDKTDPTINATAKKHDGTTYDAGTDTPQDVTVHFTCADGGSGIATCPADRVFTSVGTTTVTGTATDKAGNSASVTFGLVKIVPYSSPSPTTPAAPTDRTPPGPVTAPKAKPGDHWVVLSWVAPSANDLDYVEVRRSVAGRAAGKTISYKAQGTTLRIGRLDNNVTYKFVLVAYDKAGNASNPVVLTAKPAAVLLALPKAGTRVVKPPLLRWAPIKTADYFNVQLFRNGVKVLSAWPRFAHLQLTPGWKYGKTTITLKPGKYTWYVWPGLGKRADKRYGALLGKSTFVVLTSLKA